MARAKPSLAELIPLAAIGERLKALTGSEDLAIEELQRALVSAAVAVRGWYTAGTISARAGRLAGRSGSRRGSGDPEAAWCG
jgi:hypothetical protein